MLAATTSTVRGAGGATGAGAGGAGGCATACGCGAGGAGDGWECAQAATMNARATGTGRDRMVHSPLRGALACACPLAIGKSNARDRVRRRSPCRVAFLDEANEAVPVSDVIVEQLAQLVVLLPGRAARDRKHLGDVGAEQALAQDALSNHAGGAEEDDFQRHSLAAHHDQPPEREDLSFDQSMRQALPMRIQTRGRRLSGGVASARW